MDTYRSETAKTLSIWRHFADSDLAWRPHLKSRTVEEILRHQLLSERRFFAEFLGAPEPAPADVLPRAVAVESCCVRLAELAQPRATFLAGQPREWWLEEVPFFDVRRQRASILFRRILHTGHHRTQ